MSKPSKAEQAKMQALAERADYLLAHCPKSMLITPSQAEKAIAFLEADNAKKKAGGK